MTKARSPQFEKREKWHFTQLPVLATTATMEKFGETFFADFLAFCQQRRSAEAQQPVPRGDAVPRAAAEPEPEPVSDQLQADQPAALVANPRPSPQAHVRDPSAEEYLSHSKKFTPAKKKFRVRKIVSLSLSLSLFLSLSLSLTLSLTFSLSVCLSVCLSHA